MNKKVTFNDFGILFEDPKKQTFNNFFFDMESTQWIQI